MSDAEVLRVPETFDGEVVEVIYRKSPPLDSPDGSAQFGVGFYPPLNPRTYVENGIKVEVDVPVTLRDGVTIYVDVYRPDGPEGETDLPAIISWCWYGKRPGDNPSPDWAMLGVPPGSASKMAKIEGPDPSYWCKQGYAVINADPRGAGSSEGRLVFWGKQDGEDGYDMVEWIAAQPWSNTKVGMFGNSGLAMCQWWIAAEQPPHLAAIAPWEGTSDIYREFVTDNGIPAPGFMGFVSAIARSTGGWIEDYMGMLKEYPLMNAYWRSKIPDFTKIKIPAYVTGGWSHLHLLGSINGFRRIRSQQKWLRIHREFEWADTYSWWNMIDLKRFFDRYLKGINNGWEATPRVRLEVMDAYDYDFQVNRPEEAFPIPRTRYEKLYLDAGTSGLSAQAPATQTKTSYDAETGEAVFDITFTEDTEITGFMKAHLWVEADGHDEMDLFLTVVKLDENGEWLPTNVMGEPHPGAWGKLRVSQRALDEEKSTHYQPVQAHLSQEKLKPGEIVPVDIAFYPHSRIWHKGQTLRLRVCGRYIREGWFEPFSWDTDNKGSHVVHTGGEYDSYLQVPVIPPKYQSGDYVYR